jgi:hypothetical protein
MRTPIFKMVGSTTCDFWCMGLAETGDNCGKEKGFV